MSTYRKGLIGASISTAVLLALSGVASAQPLTKEEIEKRKAQQQQKQSPVQRQVQPQVKTPPVVKAPQPALKTPPPVVKTTPPPVKTPPVVKTSPPPTVKTTPPPVVKTLPPPVGKTNPPPLVNNAPPPLKKDVTPPPVVKSNSQPVITPKTVVTPPPTLPPKGLVPPPSTAKTVVPPVGKTITPPLIARPIGTPPPNKILVSPVVGPKKLDDLKTQRIQKTDAAGRTLFIEPGNRTIIKKDNRLIIHRDESKTLMALRPDARTMRLPNGISQSVYIRPDGIRVYSEFDGAGRLIRRYGRRPGGPDIVYLDNRKFYRNLAIGVGVGIVGAGLLLALSPPVHALPPQRYIVDYDRASDDDLYEAIVAPPVVRLERAYSLDEIRYNQALRDRMRRIDVDSITFDTGSFEITENQYGKLERMAKVIARAIEKNPAEMFLIEGHTDAVGSDDDNLTLSDRRAEAVARVLTEYYNIPMENLTTQGYGEQNLKVNTQEAERSNRRVAFRRIGPLLGQEESAN